MAKKKKKSRKGRPGVHHKGKPLWELLENLPDYGVGRLIIRGSFQQKEDEPSYMRILEVDMAAKAPDKRKKNKIRVPVKVQRIFRGIKYPRPVNICSTSYLYDFKLVPKDEEEKYISRTKTTNESGYYYHYHSTGEKKRIRALVEQGFTPYEAKQMELERQARQEAEAAERAGAEPSKEPVPKVDQSNFDDVEDEGETEDSFDSDSIPEEKVQKKKNKGQNRNDCSEEFLNQQNFENFSPEQKLRIDKMIQNGMDGDTAKQLEWERQIAFEAAAGNGCNESDAGPSRGSKRSSYLTTNAPSAKLTKIG